MASIPVVKDGNKTLTPTPAEIEAAKKAGLVPVESAPPVVAASSFTDGAMPSELVRAAASNPFQTKMNEIDKNVRAGVEPSASSYLAKNEDVDWARAKMRAAAGNIGRGATTVPIPEEGKPGYTRVWFTTKEKTNRSRK